MVQFCHRLRFLWRENWALFLVVAAACARVAGFLASYKYRPSPFALPECIYEWRNNYLAHLAPYDPSGLARGIFLGEDEFITPSITRAFRDAGLAHVLAASGYNCWIVGLLFSLPLRLTARLFSRWSWRLEPVSCTTGAFLFWLWSDQSPPVTRAMTYITIKSFLDLLQWRVSILRLVVVQYFVSLIIVPHYFNSAGFQLSFSCLLGMILGLKYSRHLCSKLKVKKILSKLALDYFCSTTGAIMGAAHATWIYFGEVNANGLLANIFVGPMVTALIMPLSLGVMAFSTPAIALWPGCGPLAQALGSVNGLAADALASSVLWWVQIMPDLRFDPYRY